MIRVESLTHYYPRRQQPALQEITFQVEAGQIFGLLGPNGAGKTTLMRILSTLILPTRGTASICGYRIGHDEAQIRQLVGLASGSERAFYYRLTVFQNLQFFGGMRGLYGQKLRQRVEHVLAQVGLYEARDVLYMRFSAGMKRRLSLARALLTDPPAYLLDEPTSGVDLASTQRIQEIIRALRDSGKTILLATHDMEEANSLSDYIGILRQGRLIALNTPFNLRQTLKSRHLIITFDEQALQNKQTIQQLLSDLQHDPRVHSLVLGNPHLQLQLEENAGDIAPLLRRVASTCLPVRAISTREATLQDVFFRLTTETATP